MKYQLGFIFLPVNENPPSNALLESRSNVAARLIVKDGVPVNEDGDVVQFLGIPVFTISVLARLGRVLRFDEVVAFLVSRRLIWEFCGALSATQTNNAVFA